MSNNYLWLGIHICMGMWTVFFFVCGYFTYWMRVACGEKRVSASEIEHEQKNNSVTSSYINKLTFVLLSSAHFFFWARKLSIYLFNHTQARSIDFGVCVCVYCKHTIFTTISIYFRLRHELIQSAFCGHYGLLFFFPHLDSVCVCLRVSKKSILLFQTL